MLCLRNPLPKFVFFTQLAHTSTTAWSEDDTQTIFFFFFSIDTTNMDSSYKRHMDEGNAVSNSGLQTSDVAGLATVGMRIRRAVAQGYNNVQVDEENINSRRTPLPAHLEGVPSLSGAGSTIESSSDLASWESRYQPQLQTIGGQNSDFGDRKNKRRLEDDDHEYGSGYAQTRNVRGVQQTAGDLQEDYSKYGQLRFDEDF